VQLQLKEITMKRLTLAVVVSAAALAAAGSVRADTRVRIGVNIGAPAYSHPAPVIVSAPAPAVVYAPAPTVVYARPPAVVVAPPRGYWKEVQVKTWVPERWVVRTNRWGRSERYCEPGYYTYRTDRVWVDTSPSRGHAYGYNHDRHGDFGPDHNRGWNR
jgi:hypothetical protein